ncbi:MAG: peptide chain release factor N(5)-glutamine methyltransferase [Ignavibacterium album]|jgi:release factor glutamine methyltransferase|uniref:peptide chain release factor N(5)-glutamine methyltransferase n=1 Tax=Ignavibacterium album TaxID=591197 RepID=UPI0026EA6255|nr:peptide chain release factor N(5)-glutamine methyltransferase [Ignavibacterium album]MCX8104358.1 peptide chain release factor N(5)-glutamine methyltransferase [Ignavibacterium album]
MITVLEALNLSTDYLNKKNIESARLNAELMLAHILRCKRLELYLQFDRPLDDNELQQYRNFLSRRANREPLQYILGEVEFFNVTLKVNKNVLIPRPETELLVEKIINDFKDKSVFRFLDIGVGSGNISIAILKNLINAQCVGIDISDEAIALANENAIINEVQDRIEFRRFDILKDNINELGKFDLIVSNPPYVSLEDYERLEPELKIYEPQIALTDYYNGMTFYKKIIYNSKSLLNENGKIYLELGKGLHEEVRLLMQEKNFSDIMVIKDFQGIERIICGEIK